MGKPDAMSSTESELLTGAAQGDAAARNQLLQFHRERLRALVARRLHELLWQRVDPSDIVQETMVVADRRLDDYLRNTPIAFYPWLVSLARDQVENARRRHLGAARRSRYRERSVDPNLSDESVARLASCLADTSMNPQKSVLRDEREQRLRLAIELLNETDREILTLRYLNNHTMQEAADILKIGLSAAKRRHLRALANLRTLLEGPFKDLSE